jgi:hypothetical protein
MCIKLFQARSVLKSCANISGDVEPEDIPELFMNLSPFEMKTLLYHILSGKEFNVSRGNYNIYCRLLTTRLYFNLNPLVMAKCSF